MKHLILVIAAFITLASCEKQAKQSSAPKETSTTMAKTPVNMTQEQLTAFLGKEVADKIFSSHPEAAKGKPVAAVAVWLNDLVLSGTNTGTTNNVTTTLPTDPNFAGIQYTQVLQPNGYPDFSYDAGGATTLWWEAGIVGSPYITTFNHTITADQTWHYRSWASDLTQQVHISGIVTLP